MELLATGNTIDGERFAGLNIRDFSTIEVFMEVFLHCLGHKLSLFSTINERCIYSQKNFREKLSEWKQIQKNSRAVKTVY